MRVERIVNQVGNVYDTTVCRIDNGLVIYITESDPNGTVKVSVHDPHRDTWETVWTSQ